MKRLERLSLWLHEISQGDRSQRIYVMGFAATLVLLPWISNKVALSLESVPWIAIRKDLGFWWNLKFYNAHTTCYGSALINLSPSSLTDSKPQERRDVHSVNSVGADLVEYVGCLMDLEWHLDSPLGPTLFRQCNIGTSIFLCLSYPLAHSMIGENTNLSPSNLSKLIFW